ncbi:MAG: protein-L-isoaspartate(D-aspartate) O-methyltransferase [Bacteroidia bacterium]|nr:protein-L-isoaspartate(D-aspartate) O-methyltransferase [Bacteroidia bacterium]
MIKRDDTYRHLGMRNQLVEELKRKGIKNEAVLRAIGNIPRHLFIEESKFTAFAEKAYSDIAFPIGAGQTISHPYTVAFQTELLEIKKGDKVLEIGTGCGYQTAVLLEMGAKVFSIERIKSLYEKTRVLLPKIGYSPRFFYGDGYKGLPFHAPFDKIIVTAAAPYIPKDLLLQMKENARMIIPIGEGVEQTMNLLTRKNGTEFEKCELGKFKFVPMLNDKS